jgi:hypothetical protein
MLLLHVLSFAEWSCSCDSNLEAISIHSPIPAVNELIFPTSCSPFREITQLYPFHQIVGPSEGVHSKRIPHDGVIGLKNYSFDQRDRRTNVDEEGRLQRPNVQNSKSPNGRETRTRTTIGFRRIIRCHSRSLSILRLPAIIHGSFRYLISLSVLLMVHLTFPYTRSRSTFCRPDDIDGSADDREETAEDRSAWDWGSQPPFETDCLRLRKSPRKA